MKYLVIVAMLAMTAAGGVAQAADSTCESRAADKHLAGAAKTSFMTKCAKDSAADAVKAQCATQAADKKLGGAAKNSFMKKCEKDAAK